MPLVIFVDGAIASFVWNVITTLQRLRAGGPPVSIVEKAAVGQGTLETAYNGLPAKIMSNKTVSRTKMFFIYSFLRSVYLFDCFSLHRLSVLASVCCVGILKSHFAELMGLHVGRIRGTRWFRLDPTE
jgi:hypothetical protein